MFVNFDPGVEAARISFAGILVALRSAGVEIVEADLNYPNSPLLKIVPEQIMAGFEDQKFGEGNLESCVGEHVPYENPSMSRRMLLAQLRSAQAGWSALRYADITGVLDLDDTPSCVSNQNWVRDLLEVFGGFLDIDEQTKEVLLYEIGKEADRVVGRNWELVTWVYLLLREEVDDIADKLHSDLFTSSAEEFPVTASEAERLWRHVEKRVDELRLEN